MNTIDLHMHSIFSIDGTYRPEELRDICEEKNMAFMAIADHNSVKGTRQLLEHGKKGKTVLIPAIELDCTCHGKDFHLLGYGINVNDPIYDKIEEDFLSQERQNGETRLDYTRNKIGFCFEDHVIEKLKILGVITPEAIMEACMMDERNRNHEKMQPYLEGGSRSNNPMVNFYWDYFSQGTEGYVPMVFPKLRDMVEMIHEQSGLAVLAHPGNNVKEDEELLKAVIDCGIDGMEVYSSYHSKKQEEYYREKAGKYHLLSTCGSDFHGKTKPSIHLGQCDCPESDRMVLEKVLKRIAKSK